MEQKVPYKIYLEENEIPKAWYNVRADMKNKVYSAAQPCDIAADGHRRPEGRILRGALQTGT